jgi:hypothetical protein
MPFFTALPRLLPFVPVPEVELLEGSELEPDADEFAEPEVPDVPPVSPSSVDSDRSRVMGAAVPSLQPPARRPAHADDVPSGLAVALSVTRLAPEGLALFIADSSAGPTVGTLFSALSTEDRPRDPFCGLVLSVAETEFCGTGTWTPPACTKPASAVAVEL